jgi:hypothetical protein
MTDKDSAGSAGRKTRRIRRWIAIDTVIIVLIIAFLPTICSLGPLRRMILKKVNARVDGTVKVEKWSLSWSRGLTFTGIEADIRTPQAATSFRTPKVSISSGLLRLLGKTKDLGTVTITEPVLSVVLPDPSAAPVPQTTPVQPVTRQQPPATEPSRRPSDEPARIGMDIKGQVKVSDARISVSSGADKDTAFELEQLDAEITIPSLNESIAFAINGKQTGSAGTIKVKGTTRLLEDGLFKPEKFLSQATVSINRLDLAGPAAAVHSLVPMPDTAGTFISDIKFNVDGMENIKAKGLVQLVALSLTGGPLGNDSPQFDSISLIFDVSSAGMALTINRFELASPIAEATASGQLQPSTDALYPDGRLDMQAEMNLAEIAARFPDTLGIKQGLTVASGAVAANASLVSSAEQLSFTCNAVTRDIAATQDGRQVVIDKPITLTASGSLDQDRSLSLDEFKLDSSFAQATGSGTPDDLTINVSADIAAALEEAGKFLDLKDADASGRLVADIQAKVSSPGTRRIAINAAVDKLSIDRIDVDEPRIDLSVSADVTADAVNIERLKLASSLVTLDCSGSLTDIQNARGLTISGKLGLGLEKLGVMLTTMTGRSLVLEGNELRDFTINTSLSGTSPDEILKGTTAEAAIHLKRVKGFGIETTPADLQIALKDGIADITLKTGANGGTVSLAPRIDASAKPPLLTIPDGSVILKDVKLTDELSSEVLGLIHPLFRGCAVLGGRVSLTMDKCHVPLSAAHQTDIEIGAKVQLNDVLLSADGIVGKIAAMMGQEIKTISIPDQEIVVRCEKGRVTPSPLTVKSKGYSVVFSGSIGLDGSMDYLAQVPLTEEMVHNAAAYEHLKGTTLKLPIGGTVSKPRISTDAFRSMADDLIKEALKKTVVKEGTKLLKDLIDKEGAKVLQNLLDSAK